MRGILFGAPHGGAGALSAHEAALEASRSPKRLAREPFWMDALSEAMRAVHLTSALFFNGEFSAPWRFATPAEDKVAPIVSPDSERLVLFHLVTEGEATARTAGQNDVSLAAGDIVVFPRGDSHEMWSGRTRRLFPGARLLPKLAKGQLAAEKWGGPGVVTRIICGYLGCERHADHTFLSGLPPERTGWLAAARDPKVGRALALLRREPGRAWTLPELAGESGTSRTVLAERFAELMGEPPPAYLGRWRLQLAARQLTRTDRKVLQVAYDVGYESEAAFSRAFKRAYGMPPARYRRASKP